MNADHRDDLTDGIDALGRRAATALHRDVEHRSDVDAALARVLDTAATPRMIATTSAGGSGPRPDRRVWLGAAAGVLLLGAGSLVFALSRDDRSRVVPADTTPVTDGTAITSITTSPTITTDQSAPGPTAPASDPETSEPPATTATSSILPVPTAALPTDVDALAGLVAPAPLDPADVPALLPPTPVADAAQVRLDEYVMPVDTVTDLVQTWATASGQVLEVTTLLAGGEPPVSVPTQESPVELWPWDEGAVVTSMADGFGQIRLSDPSGSVTLWGAGFTSDELVTIAGGMTLTPDGWVVGSASQLGLVELHAGWRRASFATRVVQWDTGTIQGELIVTLGSPESISTGYFGVQDGARLDDVQGAPALVTDLGSASAVTWSPAPDVVVALGYSGTADEALALARSIRPVDLASWRAAGVEDTSPADGCNSYFFC